MHSEDKRVTETPGDPAAPAGAGPAAAGGGPGGEATPVFGGGGDRHPPDRSTVHGLPGEEHRDSVLTEEERAAGRSMMICVGRARTPSLTLDL